ncbi:hypothetical protein EPO17_03770 [Patescibacteria group bacterium]|nr:MAG: hypothetical protein EPO17_03770 [Patescibacteria group bacterium]
MLRFNRANKTWWRKPLAIFRGRTIPAELAVLSTELKPDESGAWLNSRGLASGVVDLMNVGGETKTARIPLPDCVTESLRKILAAAQLRKGIPDLVIWDAPAKSIRLVEVKCPHWDRPTSEQEIIFETLRRLQIPFKVVEWEFIEDAHSAPSTFEFKEDRDFFKRLICQDGESFDRYLQLFDFRSPIVKRKEFNARRRGLLAMLQLKHGRGCMLAYPGTCDDASGFSVDHIIPLSSNVLNKRLRALAPKPGKKVEAQSLGSNHPLNLVLACNNCNGHKKHRLLDWGKLRELLKLNAD